MKKKRLVFVLFFLYSVVSFSQTITLKSLEKTTYNKGDTAWVTYTTSGVFDVQNSFKVELGNASGKFYEPSIYLGVKTSSVVGLDSIKIIVPDTISLFSQQYSFRIISTLPVVSAIGSQRFTFTNYPILKRCLANTPKIVAKRMELCQGDTKGYLAKAQYNKENSIQWFDGSNYFIANKISTDSIMNFKRQNEPGTWIYYAFEYDNINNCYSRPAECSFVVYSKPVVSLTLQDTVCYATHSYPVTVHPSGGVLSGYGTFSDYTFHPGHVFVNYKDTVIPITYTYADSNACIGSSSKNVYIKYIRLPSSIEMFGYLDSIPTLVAMGDKPTSIINWYSDLNKQNLVKTGSSFLPPVASLGTFTYYVTQDARGCSSDIIPIKITITDRPIVYTPITDDLQFEVFPNPVSTILHVKGIDNASVEVYNELGIKVLETNDNSSELQVQQLLQGFYFIKYKTAKTSKTATFIKL